MTPPQVRALALEHGVTDLYQGAAIALVPALVAQRGYGLADAGGAVLAATALSSVTQPVFGMLADSRSLPWLRTAGLLVAASGTGAVGLLDSYAAVCVALLVSGLGVAAYHPQAARAVHGAGGGDEDMGWFTFGGLAGCAAGPGVTAAVLATLGLAATPLLVLPAVVVALVLRPRRPAAPTGAAPAAGCGAADWPRFSVLTVVVTLRSLAYYGVTTLLVVHLTADRGLGLGLATAVLTVFTATGAASTLLAGHLSRWGSRVTTIAGAYLLSVPAVVGLAGLTEPLGLVCCAMLLGVGLHVPVPLHTTLGQDYLPRHVGTAAGVTLGLSVSAGGLGAPLIGSAAEHLGTTTALQLVAVLPLLATGSAVLLGRRAPDARPILRR